MPPEIDIPTWIPVILGSLALISAVVVALINCRPTQQSALLEAMAKNREADSKENQRLDAKVDSLYVKLGIERDYPMSWEDWHAAGMPDPPGRPKRKFAGTDIDCPAHSLVVGEWVGFFSVFSWQTLRYVCGTLPVLLPDLWREKAPLISVCAGQRGFSLGGRYWVRTSDLSGVNGTRYHCANRPRNKHACVPDVPQTLAQRFAWS